MRARGSAGILFFGLSFLPRCALACAACYGQSDSSLAQGMNWGILSLLGVIVSVLGGVAAFFVFLARRSALLERLSEPRIPPGAQTSGIVAAAGATMSGSLPPKVRLLTSATVGRHPFANTP